MESTETQRHRDTETQAARIAALEAEIARLHAVLERADDMANALVEYFNKRGADHAMWKGNEDIGDLADTLSNYGPLRLVEMDARTTKARRQSARGRAWYD